MLKEKHELIRKLAREFAQKELLPAAVEVDETGQFPDEVIRKMKECQFHCITIPEKYGGAGGDYRSLVIVMEEFCKVCAAAGTPIMPNSLSSAPIIYFGNEEQKQKYVRGMAEGRLTGAFAVTEPNAGSDVASLTATAVKDGSDYIINGRKCFTTNGPTCDFVTVFARTDPDEKPHKGISAFIVDTDLPGFSRGVTEKKMGMHGSPTCDTIFEDVRVPESALLGREGDGFKICMGTLNAGRLTISAQGLGIAAGCLEESVRYAKERIQFGRPLAKQQGIRFEIADMATQIEAGRSLVYSCAAQRDQGKDITTQAAMAKYFCGELCNKAAYKATQIFGGYGYMKEYTVERHYRDARLVSIYDGTSEIQKIVIANNVIG